MSQLASTISQLIMRAAFGSVPCLPGLRKRRHAPRPFARCRFDGSVRTVSDGIILTNGMGFSRMGTSYHCDAANLCAPAISATMGMSSIGASLLKFRRAKPRTVWPSRKTVSSVPCPRRTCPSIADGESARNSGSNTNGHQRLLRRVDLQDLYIVTGLRACMRTADDLPYAC